MNRLPDIQGIQERLIVDTSKGRQVYEILSYGSRTLTSTFVMKAANAWHQLSRETIL